VKALLGDAWKLEAEGKLSISDPIGYLFKNADPRGSLAANVSNSTVRCLSNLPLDKMLQDRHTMSQTVREEVQRAGFQLAEEGAFLRNPQDTRDWNGSPKEAGDRRGTSDRFVLKFRKP